jgi:hypothetical protein
MVVVAAPFSRLCALVSRLFRPAGVMDAQQSSKLLDEVRFLGGVLSPWSVVDARDSAEVVDQVRFLTGTFS